MDFDALMSGKQGGASQPMDFDALIGKGLVSDRPGYVGDIAKSFGTGLRESGEFIAGIPGQVTGLIPKIASTMGIDPKATEAVQRTFGMNLPGVSDIHKATTGVIGESYQPKTLPGEYAHTLGAYAPAALEGVPGMVYGGISALGEETAGQLTKGSPDEPYARLIGALASPYAAGKLFPEQLARLTGKAAAIPGAKSVPQREEIGPTPDRGYPNTPVPYVHQPSQWDIRSPSDFRERVHRPSGPIYGEAPEPLGELPMPRGGYRLPRPSTIYGQAPEEPLYLPKPSGLSEPSGPRSEPLPSIPTKATPVPQPPKVPWEDSKKANMELGRGYMQKHVGSDALHGGVASLQDPTTVYGVISHNTYTLKDGTSVVETVKGYGGKPNEIALWQKQDKGHWYKIATVKRGRSDDLEHVVVAPEFQQQGIGQYLANKAESVLGASISKSTEFSEAGANLANKLIRTKGGASKENVPHATTVAKAPKDVTVYGDYKVGDSVQMKQIIGGQVYTGPQKKISELFLKPEKVLKQNLGGGADKPSRTAVTEQVPYARFEDGTEAKLSQLQRTNAENKQQVEQARQRPPRASPEKVQEMLKGKPSIQSMIDDKNLSSQDLVHKLKSLGTDDATIERALFERGHFGVDVQKLMTTSKASQVKPLKQSAPKKTSPKLSLVPKGETEKRTYTYAQFKKAVQTTLDVGEGEKVPLERLLEDYLPGLSKKKLQPFLDRMMEEKPNFAVQKGHMFWKKLSAASKEKINQAQMEDKVHAIRRTLNDLHPNMGKSGIYRLPDLFRLFPKHEVKDSSFSKWINRLADEGKVDIYNSDTGKPLKLGPAIFDEEALRENIVVLFKDKTKSAKPKKPALSVEVDAPKRPKPSED